MLQPFAQPVHTLGDLLTNQTRLVKRKSRLSSAPTGQMSTVLPEYFESRGCPGNVAMSEYVPRCTTASCGSLAISSMKRTQRVHMMQRSASYTTSGPNSTRLGFCNLLVRMRVA